MCYGASGVLAVWSYALASFGDAALGEALHRFYTDAVGPFWAAERSMVDAGYRDLEFPFEPLPAPPISMTAGRPPSR